MKKILISAPVQNRGWILNHYLHQIKNIDYPKHLISLYFIVNNSNDNSHKILINFKEQNTEYNAVHIDIKNNNKLKMGFDVRENGDRDAKTRNDYTFSWLSELRNNILDKARELEVDYLLSLDTDILVETNLIHRLLNHDKDIIAGLIWNGYLVNPREPWKYPNILRRHGNSYKHIYNFYVKNPHKAQEGKIVEIDFTGAVFLISKKVLDNVDIKFGYDKLGEDGVFCKNAQKYGFNLYCALDSFSYHIMSKKYLELYLEDKKNLLNI